jgi:TolB-like protein/predicted Ser/Thr protein kinase
VTGDERKRGIDPTLALEFASETPWDAALGSDPPACVAERYELLGLLGSGGMGNVYRVRDLELDEVVALKFLRRDIMAAAGMLERFRQEVKLARRVTHPNVARTFDIGEHRGERFLTMEFVDGQSLTALIRRQGALPVARVVEIGVSLCAALSAAHAAGVVHRDLKPDNVLIERGGRVVVTDFGIARAVSSQTGGALAGTAAYMAPEQVRGHERIDGRADLYALGAVLFELLLGQPAWVGDDLISMAVRKLADPPPDPWIYDPSMPEALANIVVQCMATQPEDRYASADEVADALRRCQAAPGSRDLGVELAVHGRAPTLSTGVPVLLPPRVERGDRTVAVLPFRNAGPSEDDYLADELTDDLIDSLSVARGLKVRPRRMITAEIAAQSDLEAIGQALDVQVIVEGNVRRREGAVRVSARALSVAEGLQLWAKRFERPANELLAINDEVARAVIEALAGVSEAPSRRPPTDPEAVDLLVRARQALRRAWMGHMSLDQAVALFDAGLRLAPEDPALLSGYAMALARKLNYARVDAVADEQRARDAAARAIDIAPHLGESWLALATIHYTTSDWVGAVAALRAALERVPSLQKAHEMLVSIESEVGELDAALVRARRVLALDPTSYVARADLARLLALLGRFDESHEVAAEHMDHPQSRVAYFVFSVRLDLWRGAVRSTQDPPELAVNEAAQNYVEDYVRAYREATEHRALSPEFVAQWQQRAETARVGSRFRPLMFQFLVELLAHIGDTPRALAVLERAVEARLYDLVWLDRCPALARVRAEPGFASLRARVVGRVEAIRAALSSREPTARLGP